MRLQALEEVSFSEPEQATSFHPVVTTLKEEDSADIDAVPFVRVVLVSSRSAGAALLCYCSVATALSVFAVARAAAAQAVRQTTGVVGAADLDWPPVALVALAAAAAAGGAWTSTPPSAARLFRSQGGHALLQCWAALFVQVVARMVGEAELSAPSGGHAADLFALVCALAQLGVLAMPRGRRAAKATSATTSAIHLTLATSISAGDVTAQLLCGLWAQVGGLRVASMVGLPLELAMVAGLLQLVWNAWTRSDSSAEAFFHQHEEMRQSIATLSAANNRLQERLSQSISFQDASLSGTSSKPTAVLRSRFDDVVANVDGLWDVLRDSKCLPEDVLDHVSLVLKGLKKSMCSSDLFKADLNWTGVDNGGFQGLNDPWGQPLATKNEFSRMVSCDTQNQLQGIKDLCSSAPIKVSSSKRGVRRRHSGRLGSLNNKEKSNVSPQDTHLPGFVESPRAGAGGESPRLLASEDSSPRTDHRPVESFDTVDNLAQLMSSMQQKVEECGLGQWNFDAHRFAAEVNGQTLLATGVHYAQDVLKEACLEEDKCFNGMMGFLRDICSQYREVPYHNSAHAADVLNSMMFFLKQDRAASLWPLPSVARLAGFVAAAIHDVGHFGRGNRFHIMLQHPVAVLYNDASPLENMHCAVGFFAMQQPHADFLQRCPDDGSKSMGSDEAFSGGSSTSTRPPTSSTLGLSDEDFTLFRRCVIEAVLATDMAKHVETFTRFRGAVGYEREGTGMTVSTEAAFASEAVPDRAAKVTSVYLKACDIGHTAKAVHITKEMTIRIHQEFFGQGDEEFQLGLPVSPLCDRLTANIPKSQAGFLQCVVLPFYQVLHFYIPTEELKHDCIGQLDFNILHWQSPTPCVTVKDVPPEVPAACAATPNSYQRLPLGQLGNCGGPVRLPLGLAPPVPVCPPPATTRIQSLS